MLCYVYERVERVFYVVGVFGTTNTLAEAIEQTLPESHRHADMAKPFASLRDKRVMYVERVGCVAMHRGEDLRSTRQRARARALALNIAHGDL